MRLVVDWRVEPQTLLLIRSRLMGLSPIERLIRVAKTAGFTTLGVIGVPPDEFVRAASDNGLQLTLDKHLDQESNGHSGTPRQPEWLPEGWIAPGNILVARRFFDFPHIDPVRYMLVRSTTDLRAARWFLIKDSVKRNWEFLSVPHRYLAFVAALPFLWLQIHPNTVSLLALCINLIGCTAFLWHMEVAGAMILWASCLIDCSDGVVARMHVRASNLGNLIDTACDLFYHLSLFASVAYALARDTGDRQYFWLGACGIAGILGCVAYTYAHRLKVVRDDTDRHCDWLKTRASAKGRWLQLLVYLSYASKRHTLPYIFLAVTLFHWLPAFLWCGSVFSVIAFFGAVIVYWMLDRPARGRKRHPGTVDWESHLTS